MVKNVGMSRLEPNDYQIANVERRAGKYTKANLNTNTFSVIVQNAWIKSRVRNGESIFTPQF